MPLPALISCYAMSGDRERCLNGGMDEYIAKPIQSAALLKLVMEQRRTASSV